MDDEIEKLGDLSLEGMFFNRGHKASTLQKPRPPTQEPPRSNNKYFPADIILYQTMPPNPSSARCEFID